MTETSKLQIVIDAKDSASKVFDQVQTNMGKFKSKMAESASASRAFGLGLAGIGIGAVALGRGAIMAAADFEQTQIAFTTMLGSAEKAQTMLENLASFAAKTPFELKDVEKGAKGLLAFGIEEKKIIPTLKALGDVSAGLNVPMERLILNYGQVRAQGKLTGRELRDFAVAGIPVLDGLAEMLGKSTAEIGDMVSAGQIGFPELEQLFVKMTSEGGRFADLMDKQSKSLNGMISNLKDRWDLFLREQGKALLEWGKKVVEGFINLIDVLSKIIDWIKAHPAAWDAIKIALMAVSFALVAALIPAVWSAIVAFGAMVVALAPFLIGGAIVGGIVGGIIFIVKHWDEAKELLKKVWEGIKTFAISIWEKIKDSIMGFINPIVEAIEWLLEKIEKVKSATVGLAKKGFEAVKGALGFESKQTGGYISETKPYLLHKGETVIPAGQKLAPAFAGITVNILGGTYLSEDAAEQIGNKIIDKLKRQIKL